MTTEIFDVRRARDILDKAKEVGMYPDPLPDDDAKLIAEAERAVALAKQAHRVAEEAGKDKVPLYDAIIEVLFVADVDGGTPSAQLGKKDVESQDGDEGSAAESGSTVQADGATDTDAPSSPKPSSAPEAKTEPEPAPQSGGPAPGERWCDADGVLWVVDDVLEDGQLEVHMDGDREKMAVPADFLAQKMNEPAAPEKIEPEREEPSSHSSQESSPPPSTKSSEPSASGSGTQTSGSKTEEPSSGPPASGPPQPQQPSSSGSVGAGDDQVYQDLILRVQEDYESARLPLPQDVPDPPQMPADITQNESENRRLHSIFNACAARARFLVGLERQIKIGCERLQKKYMKPAMRSARAELGAKATATEVTMLAEDDEQVAKWQAYARRHADRQAAYQDLFNVYAENVSVLSRDYTMSGREMGGRS